MIQRLVQVSIGALVTFVVLVIGDLGDQPPDPIPFYATAAIIGAIASFFWPVVAGFWAARRLKERREEQIQKEVDKQLAQQNKQ